MIYLFLILLALDAVTTVGAIKYHYGTEANPFMQWLIDAFGLEIAVYGSHILVGLAIWHYPPSPKWLAALSLVFLLVVLNNLRTLLKS